MEIMLSLEICKMTVQYVTAHLKRDPVSNTSTQADRKMLCNSLHLKASVLERQLLSPSYRWGKKAIGERKAVSTIASET